MTKKNYLDCDELHQAATEYHFVLRKAQKESSVLPQVPEVIGVYILQICRQVATKGCFNRYSYLDEMVSDAIMNCTYGASMFNPNSPVSNAFNYFTTIAIQSFLQRIDKEKKFNFIKHSNFVRTYSGIDGTMLESDSDANEVSNRIVQEFEEKQTQRRNKQLEKKNKKLSGEREKDLYK